MDAGLAGGLAGGVVGVMGGVIGTYCSIRNAKGPRERALTIRLSALCWAWMTALIALAFLAPRPSGQLALLLNLPLLLGIPRMNRRLDQARAQDEGCRP